MEWRDRGDRGGDVRIGGSGDVRDLNSVGARLDEQGDTV